MRALGLAMCAAGAVVFAPMAAQAGPVECPHLVRLHNAAGEVLQVTLAASATPFAVDQVREVCATAEELPYAVQGRNWRYEGTVALAGLQQAAVDLAAPPVDEKRSVAKALLEVRNQTGATAIIDVDAREAVRVGAGKSARLRLTAGPRRLRATMTDDRVIETGVNLAGGKVTVWPLRPRTTLLTVANRWPEPLRLRVDGFDRGSVSAASDRRLDVAPGRHKLDLFAARAGIASAGEVVLQEGDHAAVAFAPPSGNLRVAAAAGQTLQVLVAGRTVLQVGPGQRADVALPVGQVTAELRDRETGRSASWQGAVRPAAQIDLALPVAASGR
jgi:hypothetical protein